MLDNKVYPPESKAIYAKSCWLIKEYQGLVAQESLCDLHDLRFAVVNFARVRGSRSLGRGGDAAAA